MIGDQALGFITVAMSCALCPWTCDTSTSVDEAVARLHLHHAVAHEPCDGPACGD